MIQLILFIFLELLVECLFYFVCGWIGNVVVRVMTLGKVDLAWGAGMDTIGTSVIGVFFLLLLGSMLYQFL